MKGLRDPRVWVEVTSIQGAYAWLTTELISSD